MGIPIDRSAQTNRCVHPDTQWRHSQKVGGSSYDIITRKSKYPLALAVRYCKPRRQRGVLDSCSPPHGARAVEREKQRIPRFFAISRGPRSGRTLRCSPTWEAVVPDLSVDCQIERRSRVMMGINMTSYEVHSERHTFTGTGASFGP